MEDMFMKTNIIKKAVSVLACVSILAGCAAMSNAAGGTGEPKYWFNLYDKNVSLNVGSKKSKDMFNYKDGYNWYLYKYSVSYVHFSGCATGAYLPGMKVRVGSQNICDVNTSKYWGPYTIYDTNTSRTYKLYNGAKKDVGIKMHFYVGEYY